jgi:glycosyltransferase involved in cell wall biosynthesis
MAGCPVVSYRRGVLPEVVEHGSGGWLVAPDDEDALVLAIAAARGLDRAAIRRRAQRKLGIERMVDAYEQALSDLAAASAIDRAS